MTVLGLAGTALPFAQSIEDEVERWLRPLRLYGEAGGALQSLGVTEARLNASKHDSPASSHSPEETLHGVTEEAIKVAAERGADAVGTADILVAVMHYYGDAFDAALRSRSSDSEELLSVLAERSGSRN